jgi:hypothetical protein
MHIGGDWEYSYASALVDFAEATDDRRQAAEALLRVFNSDSTFNEAELRRAHAYARKGLATAMHWDRMSEPSKRRYIKALDAVLPSEVSALVGFSLSGGLRMTVIGTQDVQFLDAVALGIALLVGDNSAWRQRLALCPLDNCKRVFVKSGGKGKPRRTCSEEHRRELHLEQMRRANARKPKERIARKHK